MIWLFLKEKMALSSFFLFSDIMRILMIVFVLLVGVAIRNGTGNINSNNYSCWAFVVPPPHPRFQPNMNNRIHIIKGKSMTSMSSSSNNNYNKINYYRSTRSKRSKQKYLRIQPKNQSRNNKQRIFELQTAISTFSKKVINNNNNGQEEEIIIDLHSQLHFGEEDYFQYYNCDDFCNSYDNVFYELIVSNDLLETNQDGTKILARQSLSSSSISHQNKNPVSPPPSDEATASSYGLKCQLDVIDYTKSNWIHCDVTREDYYSFLSSPKHNNDNNNVNSHSNVNNNNNPSNKPIWALSSTAMTPIQEYTSALIRPFTPSSSSLVQNSLRLFTNLFLPGANLASILRILLWILSPSPEVSILLLDWSSIVNPRPTGMISPIFAPALQSLISGNILNARKLIFAQVVVSGQTSGGKDLNIVKRRNEVALDTLMNVIDIRRRKASTAAAIAATTNSCGTTNDADDAFNDKKSVNTHRYALLYGAMHCQDLQSRLEKMGFTLRKVTWRKAWGVNVPTFGMGDSLTLNNRQSNSIMSDFVSANNPSDIAIGIVMVPLYLLIGGLDWLVTVNDIAQSLDQSLWIDAVVAAFLYLVRHLASYLALAKFVVEWDGESNLFAE